VSYPWSKPEDVWGETERFSDKAFGPASFRGPLGPLKHLEKEAREAQEATGDIEEYADCLLLVFDATRRAGFTIYDLFDAAEAKVEKNKTRKWPEWRGADPNIPLEHDRGNDAEPTRECTTKDCPDCGPDPEPFDMMAELKKRMGNDDEAK
jgi:dATP/dGTP pyrophosphohydrolase